MNPSMKKINGISIGISRRGITGQPNILLSFYLNSVRAHTRTYSTRSIRIGAITIKLRSRMMKALAELRLSHSRAT
jgi:hypothetical protein